MRRTVCLLVLLPLLPTGPGRADEPCPDKATQAECQALLRLKAAARQRQSRRCYCSGPGDCYCPPGTCECPQCQAQPAGAVFRGEIEVVCPPDALIDFDGHRTRQSGTTRLFYTPRLRRQSAYTVRCTAGGKVQEKQVSVGPGQTVRIDFTTPAAVGAPGPVYYPAPVMNFAPYVDGPTFGGFRGGCSGGS